MAAGSKDAWVSAVEESQTRRAMARLARTCGFVFALVVMKSLGAGLLPAEPMPSSHQSMVAVEDMPLASGLAPREWDGSTFALFLLGALALRFVRKHRAQMRQQHANRGLAEQLARQSRRSARRGLRGKQHVL